MMVLTEGTASAWADSEIPRRHRQLSSALIHIGMYWDERLLPEAFGERDKSCLPKEIYLGKLE